VGHSRGFVTIWIVN
jgi:Cu2+-exporting ATPase